MPQFDNRYLVFTSTDSTYPCWRKLVDQFNLNLRDVIHMLKTNYQAEFGANHHCWWIEFPDVTSKLEFEITWM